jgi:Big-like domain-containing protein
VTTRSVRRSILSVLFVLLAAGPLGAQPMARRVATIAAIRNHPTFYHGQTVVVRGELTPPDVQPPVLTSSDSTIRLLTRERSPGPGAYDVRGEVVDLGRLTADDPRLSGVDLRLFGVDPTDHWPRQGEVVLLRMTGADKAEPLPAPSVRALALEPERYEDQRVTVRGQFRGRNLYGDLPQAPAAAAESRGEFVLRSADAAIWILGKRPRGHGFVLDPESRIDTKRWAEVSGVVRRARGLVWIVADDIKEVPPEKEQTIAEAPAPQPLIPPEVRFSVPVDGETDVPLNTHVRIQFSRDIDPDSLKGHVRISYLGAESAERGEPQAPGIDTQVHYDGGSRVLDIGFAHPLERFRTMKVELLEGIVGTDGAPLAPWTLTFSLGGG